MAGQSEDVHNMNIDKEEGEEEVNNKDVILCSNPNSRSL